MADMTSSSGPITHVRPGMDVVDVAGDKVGTVEDVRMSDEGVATAEGQEGAGSAGVLGAVADAFTGGGDVPAQEQERLARIGFLRVDAKGMFTGDRYVASDEIAEVRGDTVHLSVNGDRLLG